MKGIEGEVNDGRCEAAVHEWFQLSYSNYLVLPRSLMQAMPIEWQDHMVACLGQMRAATAHLELNDNYTVLLRDDRGRIVSDQYSEYRRAAIRRLEIPREVIVPLPKQQPDWLGPRI